MIFVVIVDMATFDSALYSPSVKFTTNLNFLYSVAILLIECIYITGFSQPNIIITLRVISLLAETEMRTGHNELHSSLPKEEFHNTFINHRSLPAKTFTDEAEPTLKLY